MKSALMEVEREAGLAGYGSAEVKDAEFAVVAFLDETILSSREPAAEEWRRRPLNNDLFGQAVAGDVFFDRLHEIERRPDSGHVADVLEVYVLCLMLGFEGRFAPPLRGEADRIMDRLRHRIETIRKSDYLLSPPIKLNPQLPVAAPTALGWHWWVSGIVAATALLFLLYYWSLIWRMGGMESIGFQPGTKIAGLLS